MRGRVILCMAMLLVETAPGWAYFEIKSGMEMTTSLEAATAYAVRLSALGFSHPDPFRAEGATNSKKRSTGETGRQKGPVSE